MKSEQKHFKFNNEKASVVLISTYSDDIHKSNAAT